MTVEFPPTAGVILAGGLARRMGGGDKTLAKVGNVTLLDRVIDRLAPQCERLVLNLHGDQSRFARVALPAVADSIPDHAGPLAGILAGLDWFAANAPDIAWLVSVPGDCPFLPRDLVWKLHAARSEQARPIACAASGGQAHHVVGLWPLALREPLRRALIDEGLRKVETWTTRHGAALAEWPASPLDPFFNINRPDDLAEASRLAAAYPEA